MSRNPRFSWSLNPVIMYPCEENMIGAERVKLGWESQETHLLCPRGGGGVQNQSQMLENPVGIYGEFQAGFIVNSPT